jgi:hypothetical protein
MMVMALLVVRNYALQLGLMVARAWQRAGLYERYHQKRKCGEYRT